MPNNPNCLRCGHPFSSHRDDGSRTCKRQSLSGWDEATKTFAHQEACECEGYLGRVPSPPVSKGECPHEFIQGSRVCVQCKEAVPVKAGR